jgi:hypothetical protein
MDININYFLFSAIYDYTNSIIRELTARIKPKPTTTKKACNLTPGWRMQNRITLLDFWSLVDASLTLGLAFLPVPL